MSYLSGLRLHFAGRFQASVSTVNNDPDHFDVAQFETSWWEFGRGTTNGWWNPPGDGDWRLIGCAITGAFLSDDQPASADDPVFSCSIADSDDSAPAKLVDLDPDQQGVSTIFGLTVRIADAAGQTLAGGPFLPAPFTDLWPRGPGGLAGMGATYQSVVTGVQWDAAAARSPFLTALREASPGGLSICFNVDGYDASHTSPTFTTGRIVGTIGPASAAEPRHLVLGRHLMPGADGTLNFATAVLDAAAGKVRVDLGNALPATAPGGAPRDLGPLTLRAGDVELGQIEGYATADWYARTAGVAVLPAAGELSAGQITAARQAPLALTSGSATPATLAEAADGVHVRADTFVFRLNPAESADVAVYATRFGQPAEGVSIDLALDDSGLTPRNNEPEDGLVYTTPIVSGPGGIAPLRLTGNRIGMVRDSIDGQVYGLRPTPSGSPPGTVVNPNDFISVLLFSEWQPDEPVTWTGSLQSIFQQYYYLYPVMARFLDLSDYDSVCENVLPLRMAFSRPIEDPNSMPVTRDLSAAKRAAILAWLGGAPGSGPHDRPLYGTGAPLAPPAPAGAPPSLRAQPPAPAAQPRPVDIKSGRHEPAGEDPS